MSVAYTCLSIYQPIYMLYRYRYIVTKCNSITFMKKKKNHKKVPYVFIGIHPCSLLRLNHLKDLTLSWFGFATVNEVHTIRNPLHILKDSLAPEGKLLLC